LYIYIILLYQDISRGKWGGSGNGKIDRYPLLEGVKVKEILIIKKEIFEKIREEAIVFKRWLTGLLPRQRKARKKQVEYKTTNAKINGTTYSRRYVPTNIWQTRDSLFWKWRMVKEWDKYINDPMDNGRYPGKDLESIIKKGIV